MYAVMIAVIMFSILLVTSLIAPPTTPTSTYSGANNVAVTTTLDPATNQAKALAWNMYEYHGAAEMYADANPGHVGVIPTSALSLPTGFVVTGPWTSYQTSSGVVTWADGNLDGSVTYGMLATALERVMGTTDEVGVATSTNTVMSPCCGAVLNIPSGPTIAGGATVIVPQ